MTLFRGDFYMLVVTDLFCLFRVCLQLYSRFQNNELTIDRSLGEWSIEGILLMPFDPHVSGISGSMPATCMVIDS